MSFVNRSYLQSSRNDPYHVQYLNVTESAFLFKSTTNLSTSLNHDFNAFKSFDSPTEFNRSISTTTDNYNNNNNNNHENLYLQLSKSTRDLNNSSNSSKLFEKLYSSMNKSDQNGVGNFESNKTNSDIDFNDNDSLNNGSSTKSTFQSSSNESNNNSQNIKRRMPSKINLLSNQRARLRKLEKLMTKNVILTPIAIIFSIIIAIIIFISIFTDYYEYIYYDINSLNKQILNENNLTIFNLQQKLFNSKSLKNLTNFINNKNDIVYFVNLFLDFALISTGVNSTCSSSSDSIGSLDLINNDTNLTTSTLDSSLFIFNETFDKNLTSILFDNETYIFYKLISSNLSGDYSRIGGYPAANEYFTLSRIKISFFNNVYIKSYSIYTTYSGLWQTCNFLSESSRQTLNITRCLAFYTEHIEVDESNHNPYVLGQRLIRLQNTAACCSIICLILIVWSIITGFLSMLRKYVPLTMATGVLQTLLLTFLIFLLAIMHTKIHEESKRENCYDLKILLNIICAIRTIQVGSSLAITWIALPLCIITSTLWLYLTKVQKILVHLNGYVN